MTSMENVQDNTKSPEELSIKESEKKETEVPFSKEIEALNTKAEAALAEINQLIETSVDDFVEFFDIRKTNFKDKEAFKEHLKNDISLISETRILAIEMVNKMLNPILHFSMIAQIERDAYERYVDICNKTEQVPMPQPDFGVKGLVKEAMTESFERIDTAVVEVRERIPLVLDPAKYEHLNFNKN